MKVISKSRYISNINISSPFGNWTHVHVGMASEMRSWSIDRMSPDTTEDGPKLRL